MMRCTYLYVNVDITLGLQTKGERSFALLDN